MKKQILILILAFMASWACAQTQPQPHPADASQFDVAGVKIGMTMEQATSALARHFNISTDQLLLDNKLINPVSQKEEVMSFGFKLDDGTSVWATLAPGMQAPDLSALVVVEVNYYIANQSENRDAMLKAAIEKYGRNSNAEENAHPPLWCAHPVYQEFPMYSTHCDATKETVLEFGGSSLLRLVNFTRNAALRSYLDQQKAVVPRF